MIPGFRKRSLFFIFLALLIVSLSSCSRLLGYGILLWSTEEPPVPSGTVLPVYIRSNIDQVWVAGIPKEYRGAESRIDKFEIPLAKLELAGSRKEALRRAESFALYARTYAETLQDGLPIRESPDNGARRIYRLKLGEIVKILEPAEGPIAVGTSGAPLPGEWFRVLTEDGSSGYCFSYRLRLFEHSGGPLVVVRNEQAETEDPELERLLSLAWSPESYGTMVNSRKLELDEMAHHWSFDPGLETGIARIKTKDVDRTFSYTKIRSTGTRSWRFEGTPLQMSLRSDTTLAVQFTETSGLLRTLLFVALSSSVDDIILQETARREELYKAIYEQGPVYTSNNYGTLTFKEDGHFTWTGNMLLVPQVIPAAALENGVIDMRLFLGSDLGERYAGAFTLRFDGIGGQKLNADFMYSLDSQGFRLEYVPQTSFDNVTVARRASSPLVLYFFKTETREDLSPLDFGASPAVPPMQGEPGGPQFRVPAWQLRQSPPDSPGTDFSVPPPASETTAEPGAEEFYIPPAPPSFTPSDSPVPYAEESAADPAFEEARIFPPEQENQ